MIRGICRLLAVLAVASLCVAPRATADEGMWLYNNLPLRHLKERHNFEPPAGWADHVMKSSVRFNSGGSGSFVSSNGLVITNHHVAADTLYKVSTADRDYHHDGFLARSLEEEIKAPDLELNQLVAIEDVTARVNAAVKEGAAPAEAFQARQAEMSKIEEEALAKLDKEKYRCDVVTLYRGGQYHLYTYRKYTDVRIVFAPEAEIAFFGGDPDNFEFPRYDLDVCIMRVWEDGKPAKTEHFLRWSPHGAKEGELVFVSGHPGSTRRLFTLDALKYQRDFATPKTLQLLFRREINLQQYSNNSDEAARRAKDDLFSVQNSRKAILGRAAALQDPSFFIQKTEKEARLRAAVTADAKLQKYAPAWERISQAQKARMAIANEFNSWEAGMGFNSTLFGIARTIVRMTAEDLLPSGQRLREYRGTARDSLLQDLYSTAPIYADLEEAKLSDSLSFLCDTLGCDHELVARVLAGKGPSARAAELVQGTKLGDIEFRKQLVEGGVEAVRACNDPMIRLALLIDPHARELRKQFDQTIDEPERSAYAMIAEAIFAIEGTNTYPDATFTLRLSFGPVLGYMEGSRRVDPMTTLGGAFEHERVHGAKSPWKLPKRWHEAKDRIALDTPFNFVCTADIIGGNSGSPVVNRDAEFVGIIFDGNIQSLGADFQYSDSVARAVSVHSAAIMESLRKIYGADKLADQLGK